MSRVAGSEQFRAAGYGCSFSRRLFMGQGVYTVTAGGEAAVVNYLGLAPGGVGVYLIR
jgi:hypothetical protein